MSGRSGLEVAASETTELRADAARNVVKIRTAAITAFRGRGLNAPLDEIAAAAGVSKGTIYARFGGRTGLIDALIGELVATELYTIIDRAQQIQGPWEQVATYIRARRDLQYREPAFTDVLLASYPDSPQLIALANRATSATEILLSHARTAGVVRADFTPEDLYYADLANGLALRAGGKPDRPDYDRRTRFFLDSLRPQ